MPARDWRMRLRDVRDAIGKIQGYTSWLAIWPFTFGATYLAGHAVFEVARWHYRR